MCKFDSFITRSVIVVIRLNLFDIKIRVFNPCPAKYRGIFNSSYIISPDTESYN